MSHRVNIGRTQSEHNTSGLPPRADIRADISEQADVTLGERVKRFARHKFLGDPSFELDAMGAVSGHGSHALKARQPWSIPNPRDVHR
jgi:hypothetical protein